jgi:hypothetical protein
MYQNAPYKLGKKVHLYRNAPYLLGRKVHGNERNTLGHISYFLFCLAHTLRIIQLLFYLLLSKLHPYIYMQIYTTQSVDLAQKPAAAWSIIHSSIPPKVPSLESGNEDKTIQEAFQTQGGKPILLAKVIVAPYVISISRPH